MVRDKDFVKFLCLYGEPLPTPSASWRSTLSRTAWRRRRAGHRSLVASGWRPEPSPGVSGHWRGSDCSGALLVISRTTGGRSTRGMWAVAAASSSSAPTSIETSGKAARGGVSAGSDLYLTATGLSSLQGSVK